MWLRPGHVLSLESNGEFPFARTVGVGLRRCSVCAPLGSAQFMRRGRIRLWGDAGRERREASWGERSERAGGGEAPQEAVLWSRRNGLEFVHSGKIQILLNSISRAKKRRTIKGLPGDIPRKRAVIA
jgi:hypothetical protein